jgi:D-lyxose ketol-isomerase
MGLFGIKNKDEKEREIKYPYAEKIMEVKEKGEKFNNKEMSYEMKNIFKEKSKNDIALTKVDVYNELSEKKDFDMDTFDKSFDDLEKSGEIYKINGKYKWTK